MIDPWSPSVLMRNETPYMAASKLGFVPASHLPSLPFLQEPGLTEYLSRAESGPFVVLLWKSHGLSLNPFRPLWSVSSLLILTSHLLAWRPKFRPEPPGVGGASVRWMSILSSASQMSHAMYNQTQVPPAWAGDRRVKRLPESIRGGQGGTFSESYLGPTLNRQFI